jgi:hypothetical protein
MRDYTGSSTADKIARPRKMLKQGGDGDGEDGGSGSDGGGGDDIGTGKYLYWWW